MTAGVRPDRLRGEAVFGFPPIQDTRYDAR
jgi:hypothetical protein